MAVSWIFIQHEPTFVDIVGYKMDPAVYSHPPAIKYGWSWKISQLNWVGKPCLTAG